MDVTLQRCDTLDRSPVYQPYEGYLAVTTMSKTKFPEERVSRDLKRTQRKDMV